MKLVFLTLILVLSASFNISANEVVDLDQVDCTRKCQLYTYDFQPDSFGLCGQIEKCTIFSWNEAKSQCEVIKKGELVTYPIACRDIPAY